MHKDIRVAFWFLIGFAIVALVLPAFAADVQVPYLTNAYERFYIGQGLYTNGMTTSSDLAEEVVLRLVGSPEVRDESGKLVPRIIEIREWIPEVPLLQMPVRRLIWDADGDGYADCIAVVTGYRDGEPEFRIFPIDSRERRPMAEQGWFKVTIPPMKEA